MAKPILIPLKDDERDLLLRILKNTGWSLQMSLQDEFYFGDPKSPEFAECRHDRNWVDDVYLRIADGELLTREELLRTLRVIGDLGDMTLDPANVSTYSWTPDKWEEARRVPAVLRQRCTDLLRQSYAP